MFYVTLIEGINDITVYLECCILAVHIVKSLIKKMFKYHLVWIISCEANESHRYETRLTSCGDPSILNGVGVWIFGDIIHKEGKDYIFCVICTLKSSNFCHLVMRIQQCCYTKLFALSRKRATILVPY